MKAVTASVVSMWCSDVQNGVGEHGLQHCLVSATGAADIHCIASSKLNSKDRVDIGLEEVGDCCCATKSMRNGLKGGVLENRYPESNSEEGSVTSSTSDTSPDCGKMCEFPERELLQQDTQELIESFLRTHAGMPQSCRSRNKALPTMKRVVENLIEKHKIAYNGMISKLSMDQQEDDMSFIKVVAKNMFSDGTTNWGRIASLVAFGAVVCKHLKETGRDHCVGAVGYEISSYLLSEQRDWLLNNKTWEGFVEFFHEDNSESTVRNALVAFASVAGIGAGLAFLIR